MLADAVVRRIQRPGKLLDGAPERLSSETIRIRVLSKNFSSPFVANGHSLRWSAFQVNQVYA
jgi:hypothetical protein